MVSCPIVTVPLLPLEVQVMVTLFEPSTAETFTVVSLACKETICCAYLTSKSLCEVVSFLAFDGLPTCEV